MSGGFRILALNIGNLERHVDEPPDSGFNLIGIKAIFQTIRWW
jgi:hypothetical protein